MFSTIFADGGMEGLLEFLHANWLLLAPPLVGFVAIYLLLPKARRLTPILGGVLAGLALVWGAYVFVHDETVWEETVLFYAFAGLAIGSGVMMISQSNPVHAALSFALVVLSTCGLFLLQAAPFLMAATIIIYAGAIVVTFLFVVMLAQQEGVSNADQRSREPFLASLAGCVLMAALLCILQRTYSAGETDASAQQLRQVAFAEDVGAVKAILGDPKKAEPGNMNLKLVVELRARLTGPREENLIGNLQTDWRQMKVDSLKEDARELLKILDARGSLALYDVPGKKDTPSQFKPGTLPASNVAALGRTMFTDYLVPVELAATLLLVATIGAIVIAGRRSEELR